MGPVPARGPVEGLIMAIRAIAAGHVFVPPPFRPALADTMFGKRNRTMAAICAYESA